MDGNLSISSILDAIYTIGLSLLTRVKTCKS